MSDSRSIDEGLVVDVEYERFKEEYTPTLNNTASTGIVDVSECS